VEPSPESDADGRSGALRIDRQLWACLGDLRQPSLAWAFGFAILATVLNHVPYEFYQPYLDLLVSGTGFDGKAPAATGLHMAIGTGIGAWVAGHSAAVSRRIGRQWTLMGALALQVCIIATMGTVLHVVVAGLILLRGVPSALAAAPLRAAVTPRVPESRRATFLSLQSLVGRLAFAATLTLLGWYAGSADPDNWPALASLLRAGAAVGVVGLALLLLLRPAETSESE
ncbi:MAG: hypothetical protein ABEL76_01055, partial [Bradymonadaceae bacterium]